MLALFDRSIRELAAVGGLPLPVEAESIWEGIWHEETHHSTAMEGNTLVLREVKALLAEGRAVGNKELREYLEIEGYGQAAKWVYANAVRNRLLDPQSHLISIREIRDIHRLVMRPVWSIFPDENALEREGPGGFRQCEIQPLRPGMRVAPWVHVPASLDEWVKNVNLGPSKDQHFLYYLAGTHAAFETIHPFRDGNGRVGRLLANLLLVRNGAPPAIIHKRDRLKYLKTLAWADGEDVGPLAEVLARAVRASVEKHMLPALAGPMRLVPLSALETPQLSIVALRSAAKRNRLQTVRFGEHYHSCQHWVEDYAESRHQGRHDA